MQSKKTSLHTKSTIHKKQSAKGKEAPSGKSSLAGFKTYEFNIKQISDLLGISRSILYQLEKSQAIKGTEIRAGASTKRVFNWADLEKVIEKNKERIKVSRPDDFQVKVFANLKGGVGKSSLSSQVAMHASMFGLKTLLIDLDPQAHASLALGLTDIDQRHTLLDCLTGKADERKSIEEVIVPVTPFLSLIPSNLSLSSIELNLVHDYKRAERLKNILNPIRKKWDLIIIDTNPSASLLNINALLAADEICVVCATDFLSVTGLKQLFSILNDLQEDFKDFGPNIKIIPNLFDVREAIAQESLGLLRQSYRNLITNTVVRKNVDLKEAQKISHAVWLYNKKSTAAEDIISLTKELLLEDNN